MSANGLGNRSICLRFLVIARSIRPILLVLILIPGLACSESTSPTSPETKPVNRLQGTFVRFVEQVHPEETWRETKGRAGSEYRNVFQSPLTGDRRLSNGWPEDGLRVGDLFEAEKLDESIEGIALVFQAGTNRGYGLLTSEDAARAGHWKDVEVIPPNDMSASTVVDDTQDIGHVTARAFGSVAPIEFPDTSIPNGATLSLGIALAPAMTSTPQSATFSVAVNNGTSEARVFESTIIEGIDFASNKWQDHRIDLSQFAGESVTLSFRADGAPGSSVSPLWGNPTLHGAPTDDVPLQPNVILISLDTLRADHLGTYGYERDTSPNLDRIAKSAHVFERCIAPSSWTTPSHASVFTGLNPVVHGAGALAGYRLQKNFTTIAEIARKNGYVTGAYTDGVAIGGQLGFYQGFDRYSNGTTKYAQPAPPGEAGKTFDEATRWLNEFGDLPFMLFVHTYEIHWPYHPPKGFENRFTSTPVDPVDYARLGLFKLFDLTEDAPERQILEDLYDGGIAYTDTVVGQFFEYLDRSGLLENTVVIIFSDHGEEFWEHDAASHGFNLYDDVLHVPLIIHIPGDDDIGTRIQTPVALEDVFQTVADLIGVDVPETVTSQSLIPLMRNQSDSAYQRDLIVSQLAQAPLEMLMLAAEANQEKYITYSIITHETSPIHDMSIPSKQFRGGEKELQLIDHLLKGNQDLWNAASPEIKEAIVESANEQLYRLVDDPGEQDSVADRDAKAVQYFRSALKRYLANALDTSDSMHLVVEQAPLSDEEIAELGALGYVAE